MERILIMRHLDKNMAIGMCHRCGKERVFRVDDGKRETYVNLDNRTVYVDNKITYECMACAIKRYTCVPITNYPMDWSVS